MTGKNYDFHPKFNTFWHYALKLFKVNSVLNPLSYTSTKSLTLDLIKEKNGGWLVRGLLLMFEEGFLAY